MSKITLQTHITRIKLVVAVLMISLVFIAGCSLEKTAVEETSAVSGKETVTETDEFVPVFEKSEIPEDIRNEMYGVTISDKSHVSFDELSYLTLTYVGYDGESHIGNMVIDKELADEVIEIFKELYEIEFPIEKMRLACEYDGVDEMSMRDNNTSAFNDRPIAGGTGLSYHQLGRAIDINPLVNPYIRFSDNLLLPETAGEYLDRNLDVQGMIKEDSECVAIFKKYGWAWGGDWNSLKDYQHFEKRN